MVRALSWNISFDDTRVACMHALGDQGHVWEAYELLS